MKLSVKLILSLTLFSVFGCALIDTVERTPAPIVSVMPTDTSEPTNTPTITPSATPTNTATATQTTASTPTPTLERIEHEREDTDGGKKFR